MLICSHSVCLHGFWQAQAWTHVQTVIQAMLSALTAMT